MEHSMKLYDLIDEWHSCNKYRVKDSTNKLNTYIIKRIKKNQSDMMAQNFTSYTGQRLLDSLFHKGYAKSSIRQVRTLLKQVFNYAVEKRYIDSNPILRCFVHRMAPEELVQAFSREEQKTIEEACTDILHGDAFIFFMYTGLRLTELCNLKWTDYDENNNLLYVRESKTKSGIRTIYLIEKAKDILNNRPKINQYIFNSKTGTKFTKEVIKKLCHRLRKRTGIEKIKAHRCRHTFATRLIEEGTNPKAAAVLIGHKNVRFTYQVYVSVESQRLVKEVCKLDNLAL